MRDGSIVDCWTKYFADEVAEMPVQDPEEFKQLLNTWVTTPGTTGALLKSSNTLGFIDDEQ